MRPLLSVLVLGVVLGVILGGLDAALALLGDADTSFGRRGPAFVGYAVLLDATVVVALALLLLAAARVCPYRARLARLLAPCRALSSRLPWRAGLLVAFLGVTGLVAFALARLPEPRSAEVTRATPPANAPNVVLILVDTLRADELGAYGGAARTPHLDALAERGALFERVYPTSSWTLPSVTSLLTSSYPRVHGYVDFDGRFPANAPALPGVLRAAGWSTYGVVGNPLLRIDRGFDRDFDLFDVYGYTLEGRLWAPRLLGALLRRAGRWPYKSRQPFPVLDSRPPYVRLGLTAYVLDETINRRVLDLVDLERRPFFLYVHYSAPHTPYLEHPLGVLNTSPALAPENLDRLRELYRGEVEYVDRAIGELLQSLEGAGALENAYVVVTSDHGEELHEHGKWEHGYGLYEEVLRVPLLVQGPGIEPGTRVTEAVRLLDVAPTVLDLAGVPAPGSFSGHSLARIAGGAAAPAGTVSFGELTSRFLNPDTHYFSAVSGRWKIVRTRAPEGDLRSQEAYDLVLDPHERSPLAELGPELQELALRLDRFEDLPVHAAGQEPTPDELRAMEALGYVGNGRE